MSRFARATNDKAFSAQCDHCEKFYFRSDVRDAVILNRKTGESDTFRLCQKCRDALAIRIGEDAAKVYGIDVMLYLNLQGLWKKTLYGANKSNGKKAHTISVNDLIKLWLIQSGKCAMTGRALDFDGDAKNEPSVDRIDSLGSYTLGNIQLVTQMVNIMKNEYPIDEFVAVCAEITHRRASLARAA